MLDSALLLPIWLTNPKPEVYLNDNYCVLDFETTNLDFGSALNPDNRLVLSTWRCGSGHPTPSVSGRVDYQYYSRLPDGLRSAIEHADFVVAQHSKFELQWLAREGVDISRLIVYDTLLGEYVRLGNRRGPKDLDSLAKRYGLPAKANIVKLMLEGGVCPSEIPRDWLINYGCGDTSVTEKVFLRQREELSGLGLLPHLYTRCLLTPVLADIERHGMQLDERAVEEEYTARKRDHDVAFGNLSKSYPTTNWGSPKQIGKLLYDDLGFSEIQRFDGTPDRTESDGRRTDGDTIQALEAANDAQRQFKEIYADLASAKADLTFLEKMHLCVQESGGLLHAQYNQSVTQNHRLSSSGRRYKLQFQNFPRRYKRLFRARHRDWYVAEGDGVGMEFRIGAHLTRDQVALSDIRGKKDVHKATAAAFYKKPEASVTPGERQEVKPETFRPMYGSKGQTPEQKSYAKYFHGRYKGMYDTQMAWCHEVLREKKLTTEWGFHFYWPGCKMSPSGYIDYTTNIFNYPISSFATGEIIPITLIHVWHYLKALKLNSFLVNTIHDSVVGEVPEYEKAEFTDICNAAFTRDTLGYLSRVYGVDLVVPLGVELKFGTNWSMKDGGESVFELDPLNLS